MSKILGRGIYPDIQCLRTLNLIRRRRAFSLFCMRKTIVNTNDLAARAKIECACAFTRRSWPTVVRGPGWYRFPSLQPPLPCNELDLECSRIRPCDLPLGEEPGETGLYVVLVPSPYSFSWIKRDLCALPFVVGRFCPLHLCQ